MYAYITLRLILLAILWIGSVTHFLLSSGSVVSVNLILDISVSYIGWQLLCSLGVWLLLCRKISIFLYIIIYVVITSFVAIIINGVIGIASNGIYPNFMISIQFIAIVIAGIIVELLLWLMYAMASNTKSHFSVSEPPKPATDEHL